MDSKKTIKDKIFTKSPFTAKEDEKLRKIVKSYERINEINWQFVAQQMETRNSRQCKDRWINYLDSKINREPFRMEENYYLLKLVEEYGRKWKFIAKKLKNRTDVSVKAQYRKLMRRSANLQNVHLISTTSYSIRGKSKKSVNNDEESKAINQSCNQNRNEAKSVFDLLLKKSSGASRHFVPSSPEDV
ncbi:Myb-like DNA-binding domain containing protein [Trichomonas vaginalis G3]|uniref:Myb-like DNA-binding domain containing protein n=1 Tax=Trichomonas vaginalis (strain ATCC PRA-98 / G3) TaxID=412133 RepID=A2GK47_TRIV3|nr:RNA polymerase II transcription regulator recruiting protein [Trichomonas vaginalis G3]EAX82470.1 Myb-like DNA-binding domain containing protein [Trichomonas vaginalis G3]KAI5538534.1 RNA polymerase II transcription regulator recruiting protein [Trichomonas vaginalis G3]|eukprot:XP_001295400.1 Myb-like DNA-binding domain containing protein [Trichomonas vaginalis G3]